MKVSLVYVGQLRTWKNAIPRWRSFFHRFKPDVYLFIHEPTDHPSIDEFKYVFGPDVNIKHLYFWTKEDIEEWSFLNKKIEDEMIDFNNIIKYDGKASRYSCQYYQLQRAFRMFDFSNYDVVLKFRYDAILKSGRYFNIDCSWDKPEEVIPHISKIWRECIFPDSYADKIFCKSYLQYDEGITLGGHFFINEEKEFRNIDKDKVIWMMGDIIYFGSGKNMQKLNQNIFDNYGKYHIKDLFMSWTPEANLFFHAKKIGLQPLMSSTVYVLR